MSAIQKQTIAKSWRKGAPPSLGWWPARLKLQTKWCEGVRWWDGERWSLACFEGMDSRLAGHRSTIKSAYSVRVQYRERPSTWPARSLT